MFEHGCLFNAAAVGPQGNYKKIQRIDVANNLLARVPAAMGHLKLLKEFNLRYNSLDERWVGGAQALDEPM
jgi:hypothetical protein